MDKHTHINHRENRLTIFHASMPGEEPLSQPESVEDNKETKESSEKPDVNQAVEELRAETVDLQKQLRDFFPEGSEYDKTFEGWADYVHGAIENLDRLVDSYQEDIEADKKKIEDEMKGIFGKIAEAQAELTKQKEHRENPYSVKETAEGDMREIAFSVPKGGDLPMFFLSGGAGRDKYGSYTSWRSTHSICRNTVSYGPYRNFQLTKSRGGSKDAYTVRFPKDMNVEMRIGGYEWGSNASRVKPESVVGVEGLDDTFTAIRKEAEEGREETLEARQKAKEEQEKEKQQKAKVEQDWINNLDAKLDMGTNELIFNLQEDHKVDLDGVVPLLDNAMQNIKNKMDAAESDSALVKQYEDLWRKCAQKKGAIEEEIWQMKAEEGGEEEKSEIEQKSVVENVNKWEAKLRKSVLDDTGNPRHASYVIEDLGGNGDIVLSRLKSMQGTAEGYLETAENVLGKDHPVTKGLQRMIDIFSDRVEVIEDYIAKNPIVSEVGVENAQENDKENLKKTEFLKLISDAMITELKEKRSQLTNRADGKLFNRAVKAIDRAIRSIEGVKVQEDNPDATYRELRDIEVVYNEEIANIRLEDSNVIMKWVKGGDPLEGIITNPKLSRTKPYQDNYRPKSAKSMKQHQNDYGTQSGDWYHGG